MHKATRTIRTATARYPGYTVVGLTGSWQITDGLQLFGRINNLFDTTYALGGVLGENFFNGTGSHLRRRPPPRRGSSAPRAHRGRSSSACATSSAGRAKPRRRRTIERRASTSGREGHACTCRQRVAGKGQTKRAAFGSPYVDYSPRLAVVDVHRHFEAEAHFGEFRLGPHGRLSSLVSGKQQSSDRGCCLTHEPLSASPRHAATSANR